MKMAEYMEGHIGEEYEISFGIFGNVHVYYVGFFVFNRDVCVVEICTSLSNRFDLRTR